MVSYSFTPFFYSREMLTAALLLLGLKVLGQTRVKGLDLVLVTCDSSRHGRSGVFPAQDCHQA